METLTFDEEYALNKLLRKAFFASAISSRKRIRTRESLLPQAVPGCKLLLEKMKSVKFKKRFKYVNAIRELMQQLKPEEVRKIIELIHKEVTASDNIYELTDLGRNCLAEIINSSDEDYISDVLSYILGSVQSTEVITFYSEMFGKTGVKAKPAIPLLLRWLGYSGNIELDKLKALSGDKNLDHAIFQTVINNLSESSRSGLLHGAEYFSNSAKAEAAQTLRSLSYSLPEAFIPFLAEMKSIYSAYPKEFPGRWTPVQGISSDLKSAIDNAEQAQKMRRKKKS